MQFTKYNGLGNDFVFVNTFKHPVQDPFRAAKILCDRRRGVGADGLILIGPSAVNDVRMRVWERGAGITQACGTGACASVVAAVISGKTNRHVTVKLDGGALQIDWPEQTHIFMTGPAEKTFTGTWEKPL